MDYDVLVPLSRTSIVVSAERPSKALLRTVGEMDTSAPAPTVRLTFDQLALIYKSLLAARALGVWPPRDELLDDTMQVVDQALDEAVGR